MIEKIIVDTMDDYGFSGGLEMDSRGRTQSFRVFDYTYRESVIGHSEVNEFAAALEDSIQDYLSLATYYDVHVMVDSRDIFIDFTN
jgi:hypothetical protein